MHKTATLLAVLAFLFLAVLPVVAIAAEESITLTTYYPSPYGVYKNLRINPGQDALQDPNDSCNENQEGTLSYYKSATSADWASAMLLACLPNKTATSQAYTWQPVGGVATTIDDTEMYVGGAAAAASTVIPYNNSATAVNLGLSTRINEDKDCDHAGSPCNIAFAQALNPRLFLINGDTLQIKFKGMTKSDYVESAHTFVKLTEKVVMSSASFRLHGIGPYLPIVENSTNWDNVLNFLLSEDRFAFPERDIIVYFKNHGTALVYEKLIDSNGIQAGGTTTEMGLSRNVTYLACSTACGTEREYKLVVVKDAAKTYSAKLFSDVDSVTINGTEAPYDFKITFTFGPEIETWDKYIEVLRGY